MAETSKGYRRKTRRKLKAEVRHKFKPEDYLKEFKPKDKVIIKQNPSSHKGMPFPKFKGNIGEVLERRGDSYIVRIFKGKKPKYIITRPEHIRKVS